METNEINRTFARMSRNYAVCFASTVEVLVHKNFHITRQILIDPLGIYKSLIIISTAQVPVAYGNSRTGQIFGKTPFYGPDLKKCLLPRISPQAYPLVALPQGRNSGVVTALYTFASVSKVLFQVPVVVEQGHPELLNIKIYRQAVIENTDVTEGG